MSNPPGRLLQILCGCKPFSNLFVLFVNHSLIRHQYHIDFVHVDVGRVALPRPKVAELGDSVELHEDIDRHLQRGSLGPSTMRSVAPLTITDRFPFLQKATAVASAVGILELGLQNVPRSRLHH